jgi:hypothetical protein
VTLDYAGGHEDMHEDMIVDIARIAVSEGRHGTSAHACGWLWRDPAQIRLVHAAPRHG